MKEESAIVVPMKYVLLYEAVDDFRPKALQLFEQHRALWRQFLEVGTLLMVGNFTDEPAGGAWRCLRPGKRRKASLRRISSLSKASLRVFASVSETKCS